MNKLLVRIAAALTGIVLILGASATAWAQKFEKVEGNVRENIPAAPFLAIAYGFFWVAIFVYVGLVARRIGQVRGEIDELRRRVSGGR